MDSGSDRSLFSFLSSILSENLPRLWKRYFFVLTGTKVLFLLVYYQNLTNLLDRRFVMCTIVDNQKMGHFRVLPSLPRRRFYGSSYFLLPHNIWGSRDGGVVRALAFHQCDPGSIPGLDVICGLSLLLVLFSAPRGFSPGTPVFPSPQKPTFLNSNSIRNARAFNT